MVGMVVGMVVVIKRGLHLQPSVEFQTQLERMVGGNKRVMEQVRNL